MKYAEAYNTKNIIEFKKKALIWAKNYTHFTFLENNSFQYPNKPFRNLLALGVKRVLQFNQTTKHGDSFGILKNDVKNSKNWLFGYLGYDLKNEIEKLESNNPDLINAPSIYFYEPEYVLEFFEDKVIISSDNSVATLFNAIQNVDLLKNNYQEEDKNIEIQQKVSEQDYCKIIENIQNNILEGDVYELNFCMEFFAKNAQINPLQIFDKLNTKSPMPFAAFQKINEHYLICASPERFLKKVGKKLISQPIKGTIGRGKTHEEDKKLKKQLFNDEKERAENMMIVDLVRNDLARSSEIGTTKVTEMFGIYTFEQLHQMISTVKSELRSDVHFVDAIKNAFPMGSMTGAPKVATMKLIEHYEQSKRGIYSGAVGYISPNGDFDFNVVIRSIIYDSIKKILSFQVGGAITYDSVPQKEYQECLLKAKAIFSLFDDLML